MQKLFTASQIRAWDSYTIAHEPISSIHLMERAAIAFKNWFVSKFKPTQKVHVFCGPGNNGGDGFAISRLLVQKGYQVTSYLINTSNKLSDNCQENYKKLAHVETISGTSYFNQNTIDENDIIIDAIFGSGLSRSIAGIYKFIINVLNTINCNKIAVDVPSGMYSDSQNLISDTILKVDTIATFQTMKRSFFFKENKDNFKAVILLDIGLSKTYYKNTKCNWYTIDQIAEIPGYDKHTTSLLENATLTNHSEKKTLEIIEISLKAAYKQKKHIHFKRYYNYIISPEKKVYIISNSTPVNGAIKDKITKAS
jgi:NAD(P)H-hydrate epimerase